MQDSLSPDISRILYWNCNGLTQHCAALDGLFSPRPPADDSSDNDNDFPIVLALVETHLHSETDAPPKLYGYECVSIPHEIGHGGLAFYVRRDATYRYHRNHTYIHPDTSSAFAWLSVRLHANHRRRLAHIGLVYIHPSLCVSVRTEIMNRLRDVVGCFDRRDDIFIVGDFNSRHPSWGDTITGQCADTILNFLTDTSMFTINQHFLHGQPTRPEAGSTLDLVITNHPSLVDNLTFADEYGLVSDHRPLLLHIRRLVTDPLVISEPPLLSVHRHQWQTHNVQDWAPYTAHVSMRLTECTQPLPSPTSDRCSTQCSKVIYSYAPSESTLRTMVEISGRRYEDYI